MGIQDLYVAIKRLAPEQIVTYHLSEFQGYCFAIDISIFLYKYIRSAGPYGWMNAFILLLCTLKKYGIKAVCIFDGPNPPEEKRGEQQRRREENKKAIFRLEEAKRLKEKIQDKYLFVDTPLPEKLASQVKVISGKSPVNIYDSGDVVDFLNTLIEKLEKQTLPITDDYRIEATKMVEMMGLCAIRADGEAEGLCAYLAVKGIVDAVLTEDTDVLAYGTPLMLAFKDGKLSEQRVVGIHLPNLLESMEMTFPSFRDLCILLSCDYNSRVKGYPPDGRNRKKPVSIGVTGAIAMIQEYHSLETSSKYIDDVEPLKYERCRELFSVEPLAKQIPNGAVPLNKPPKFEELEKYINEKGISINISFVKECWKPTEIVFEDDD